MIKVIIERKITEGFEKYYDDLIRESLASAKNIQGFLSSDVLVDYANNSHRIVITTWHSLHNWKRWYESADRQKIFNRIQPVLMEEERIIITRKL